MDVVVLVGTRKGLFLLEGDEERRDWTLRGPFLTGWMVFHAVVDPAAAGEDEGARTADTLARTRDGRPISVRLFASVLRGTDGKPVGWSVILRDLTEQRTLAEMSERLQEELMSRNRLEGIVGNSGAMDEVRDRIRRVARFNSSVLLLGQSGTEK